MAQKSDEVLLVGILRVKLVSRYELMVKVKRNLLTCPEKSKHLNHIEQQRVKEQVLNRLALCLRV